MRLTFGQFWTTFYEQAAQIRIPTYDDYGTSQDAEDEMEDDDDAFVDPDEFETFTGDTDQELSEVGKVRSDFHNASRYNPY